MSRNALERVTFTSNLRNDKGRYFIKWADDAMYCAFCNKYFSIKFKECPLWDHEGDFAILP